MAATGKEAVTFDLIKNFFDHITSVFAGKADLDDYLKSADAASTYETLEEADKVEKRVEALETKPEYTLPVATASTLGGVKQGANVTIAEDGTISVDGGEQYTLPTASASVKGGVKIGTGLEMSGEVLNATAQPYTLPVASSTTLGGVKQGQNITIAEDGTISAEEGEQYVLPTASASVKGGVKIGTGLEMSGEVLNATAEPYTLPIASADALGGIKVGSGLSIDSAGILSAVASGGGEVKVGTAKYMSPSVGQWYKSPGGSCSIRFNNFAPLFFSIESVYVENKFEIAKRVFFNFGNSKDFQVTNAETSTDNYFMTMRREEGWDSGCAEVYGGLATATFATVENATDNMMGVVGIDGPTVKDGFDKDIIFTTGSAQLYTIFDFDTVRAATSSDLIGKHIKTLGYYPSYVATHE